MNAVVYDRQVKDTALETSHGYGQNFQFPREEGATRHGTMLPEQQFSYHEYGASARSPTTSLTSSTFNLRENRIEGAYYNRGSDIREYSSQAEHDTSGDASSYNTSKILL